MRVMHCGALTNDRLLDHADGFPEPAVSRHLPTCPACAARLADLRAIAAALRAGSAEICPDRDKFEIGIRFDRDEL